MFSELLMQREDEKNPIRVGVIGTDNRWSFDRRLLIF